MRALSLVILLGNAACLFPSPGPTALYACSNPGDCPNGQYCAAGSCTPGTSPPADAGPCAAPSCSNGALLLCDGGVIPCGASQACDLGQCLASCSAGCVADEICDQAAEACVPTSTCQQSGDCSNPAGFVCTSGICVAASAGTPIDAGCGGPTLPLADAGTLTIGGAVSAFLSQVDSVSLDGGTVIFLFDGGATSPGTIQYFDDVATYSVAEVPVGPATAVVSGVGLVTTYFPNLEIRPGTSSLSLDAVISAAYLAGLGAATGVSAAPGQLVWVGQASTCDDGNLIEGYTAGLSPKPAFLGYYGPDSVTLQADAAEVGAFVAYGAPYAPTSYVLDLGGAPLLEGAFTPPLYASDAGPIAVAIIYPNVSQ